MTIKIDPSLHVKQKPSWIKVKLPNNPVFWNTSSLVKDLNLVTVCEEAHCPNRWECWGRGTATFMIAGDRCTRACGFCAVETRRPLALEDDEPIRISEAVNRLNLKHVVITAVARDDLQDGGASHMANTIREVRRKNPKTIIEVLAPDFNGDKSCLWVVMEQEPDIFNHNLETVKRLTPLVRSKAKYNLSLKVLSEINQISKDMKTNCSTKSGLMLGLGESEEEILEAMDDLISNNVSVLTLGQYLRPSIKHLPVIKYISPEDFEKYRLIALEKGFDHVSSGPLVRSSYYAEDFNPKKS